MRNWLYDFISHIHSLYTFVLCYDNLSLLSAQFHLISDAPPTLWLFPKGNLSATEVGLSIDQSTCYRQKSRETESLFSMQYI